MRTKLQRSRQKSASTRKGVENTVKTVVREASKARSGKEFRDAMAGLAIKRLLTMAQQATSKMKTPVGVTGLSLMPTDARDVTLNGSARGDVTSSMSLYGYRPPRKSNLGEVKYCQKTMVEQTINIAANAQGLFDIPILDAVPVKDNQVGDTKYSNLSVERAFDQALGGRYRKYVADQVYDPELEQTSMHFESLTNEVMFTNNGDQTMFLDIYELVPQHNLGPSTYYSAIKATGYMSPYYCFEQGVENQTIITDDTPDVHQLAFNPYNSTMFSRTWKQVKHVRVNLTGGSTHRHKSVYSINKTVNFHEMMQFGADGGKFAGWNPTLFCVMRGAPGLDPAGDVPKRAVPAKITYLSNMQLNYSANPTAQAKVIVYDDAV